MVCYILFIYFNLSHLTLLIVLFRTDNRLIWGLSLLRFCLEINFFFEIFNYSKLKDPLEFGNLTLIRISCDNLWT